MLLAIAGAVSTRFLAAADTEWRMRVVEAKLGGRLAEIPLLNLLAWLAPKSPVYLAALAGVDSQLYEAARVDGAGRWRQFWHITLPAIRPTIVVMAILTSGHLMDSGFEQIWLMTTSLNRDVADVFDTFVYYIGITQGSFSYATAVGLFKGVIGVVLIFGSNFLAKRLGQRGLF